MLPTNKYAIWDLADDLSEIIKPLYPATGEHNVLHPMRMMAMVPEFCSNYALPASDFLLASAFHDTGRINDDEDELHGARSATIMHQHTHASMLAQLLVREHCKNNLPLGQSTDHLRYIMFFKDLDAIDRQRFGAHEQITLLMTNSDRAHWMQVNRILQKCQSWQEMIQEMC